MSTNSGGITRILKLAAVPCLLIIFFLELNLSIGRQSQTWDESAHIFAGYRQWRNLDFGINPEHPPLLKFLATAPILKLPLKVPSAGEGYFKMVSFGQGHELLYKNNADQILFRTRMAASLIAVLVAALVFAAGYEFFGAGAGLLALLLLVFEPNLIAHGAVVATDMAASCFLFAAVYAYYRFLRKPGIARFLVVGVASGLALASKHSAVLLFPVLLVLGIAELILRRFRREPEPEGERKRSISTQTLKGAVALAGIVVIAVAVLWSFYGFRYAARPQGLSITPSFEQFLMGTEDSAKARSIGFLAKHHVLPESYLYGLVDVLQLEEGSSTYIFGKVYPHGKWFYFPAAFVIKSTIPLLVLLLLVPLAIWKGRMRAWRELIYIVVPPALYFTVAVLSRLNIGLRHILPIYPFLIVLAGAAAWKLAERKRAWAVAVAVLLAFHAVTSVRVFPTYLAYANELWGGPSNTYKLLTDSNTDWAQQLKATKQYLDSRGIKECWFAYFAGGVAEPGYYGIPCQPLPSVSTSYSVPKAEVPSAIDGTVLISAATLSGYETGPGPLNPYTPFQYLKPTAIIQHGLLVFDGHFEVPLAAATNHINFANVLLMANRPEMALAEARTAVQIAPEFVQTQMTLAQTLSRLNRKQEAVPVYQRALVLAQDLPAGYREGWTSRIQRALQE